jgi:hypothetical protein
MVSYFGVDFSVIIAVFVLFVGLIGYLFIIPYMTFRRVKTLFTALYPEIQAMVKKLITDEFSEEKLTLMMQKQAPVILDSFKAYASSPTGKAELSGFLAQMIPELIALEISDGERHMPLPNFFASVVTENFLQQLNSMKSSVGRKIDEVIGDAGGDISDLIEGFVPKKYQGLAKGMLKAKSLYDARKQLTGGIPGNGGNCP